VLEVKSLSPSFVANSSDFANKIGPLIVEMGNEPKKDVAARFDILSNTLSTILKNKEKIVE
jgi:hypothetical protein